MHEPGPPFAVSPNLPTLFQAIKTHRKPGSESTTCLNLENLNIPFCYDKFVTTFLLPDGSYGFLNNGTYSSPSGTANLQTGNYSASGSSGNLYSSASTTPPSTATLSIPAQYTGTGVGGALPANSLGNVIVYTTVLPGTTVASGDVVSQTTVIPTTLAGSSVSSETTVLQSTATSDTVIGAQTSVVTSTAAGTASTNAPKSGAPFVGARDALKGAVVGISGVGALMWML